ncbi:MAG: hypothetical protein KUA37_06530 [Desulfomicrobium sp.]|nr:hypothetical protein [Pseudomonadota bacterium]MBV1711647.1 hypothetical protein [Desulfomicrobium sp.]MBU4569711.1 hypothetical protein [Pseudomonadota bacterium]MBU4595431.1 hypothetical protein [Pseudomonadota bacterium]MBV1718722.1 hypothetical protein [Desulfomicrobium sp.]
MHRSFCVVAFSLIFFCMPWVASRALATEPAAGEALILPDMNGQRLASRRPLITAPIPPGAATLRMSLDDVDVTPLAVITETTVSYTPEFDLDYGSHTVMVEALDQGGQPLPDSRWHFSIPQSDTWDRASASFQLDTNLVGKLGEHPGNTSPDWQAQTSGTLSSELEKGKFRVTLDANGWFVDDSDNYGGQDKFSLNTYLLKLAYDEQSLSLGDVSVETTELAGGSLARRGGLLELNAQETSLQGFVLRSNTVADFDHLLPVEDSNQRFTGMTLTQGLYPEKDVQLKATAVTGQSGADDNVGGANLVPETKGQIYSVALSGTIVDELLLGEVEYARSSFNQDTQGPYGTKHGQAWRSKLSGRHDTLDYGGGYSFRDKYFQSIISPGAINNRKEYSLHASKTFEESSLSFNGMHSYDNVEKLENIPTVRSTGLDLGYTLNKADWPFLFANANLSWQRSGHEPDGFSGIDNQSRILSVGLSLARETWSVVPSYVFTSFDDKSGAGLDSLSHQILLSLGWQPLPELSFNPAVTYARTETDPGSLVTEDWLAILSTTWLITDSQNLNLTLSGLDSRTNDDSMHVSVFNGQAQYNWILGANFLESVTKTVGLSGQYSRTKDHVGNTDNDEYIAFLSLNFSIPVAWP